MTESHVPCIWVILSAKWLWMGYLGISPSVCKLRQNKLWISQIETSHANLSPGQTTPLNHCHNHRGTWDCICRGATCCYKKEKSEWETLFFPPQLHYLSRTGVPVWSVRGVRAGCGPVPTADPGVFLCLGVPPRLRVVELSEPDARSGKFVLQSLTLWWNWSSTQTWEDGFCH